MTAEAEAATEGPWSVGDGVLIGGVTPGVVVDTKNNGMSAMVLYGNLVMQRLEQHWFSQNINRVADRDVTLNALHQSQALLERLTAWAQGQAEFSDDDLATCMNTVLDLLDEAIAKATTPAA
jgi:hypothetical protein